MSKENKMHANKLKNTRRGIAAVEFAILSPVFVILVLGTAEVSHAINASTTLTSAIREGGRLASMDWAEIIADDVTANAKIEQDIRNFLTASGLPGSAATIQFLHTEPDAQGEYQTFDLADPDNYLGFCKIHAEIEYSDVSLMPYYYMDGKSISADFVFRMGRVSLVQ